MSDDGLRDDPERWEPVTECDACYTDTWCELLKMCLAEHGPYCAAECRCARLKAFAKAEDKQ